MTQSWFLPCMFNVKSWHCLNGEIYEKIEGGIYTYIMYMDFTFMMIEDFPE